MNEPTPQKKFWQVSFSSCLEPQLRARWQLVQPRRLGSPQRHQQPPQMTRILPALNFTQAGDKKSFEEKTTFFFQPRIFCFKLRAERLRRHFLTCCCCCCTTHEGQHDLEKKYCEVRFSCPSEKKRTVFTEKNLLKKLHFKIVKKLNKISQVSFKTLVFSRKLKFSKPVPLFSELKI